MNIKTKTNKVKLAEQIAENNKKHEKVIRSEDVINFLITLNTAKSFDDLLERM